MKAILSLLSLSLLLVTSSCSKGGVTDSSMVVSIGSIATASLANYSLGGAMLYGENFTTGDKFALNLIDADGPLEFELPNGDWKFSGFIWEGSSNTLAMTGHSYCTEVDINLAGGDVDIPLNFTNEQCASFTGAGTMTGSTGSKVFPNFNIQGCRKLDNVTNAASSCTTASDDEGIPRSYVVVLRTFKTGGDINVGGALVSNCQMVNGAKNANMSIQLPNAVSRVPFSVEIVSFFDSSCIGTGGTFSRVYENGVNDGDIDNDHKVYFSVTTTHIFHEVSEQDVCSSSTLAFGSGLFSSGNGTADSPYGICFPWQWDNIGQGGHTLAQSYELLSDLNFSGRSTGFAGAVDVPNATSCVGLGGNFRPVGDVLATTTTVDCDTSNDGSTSTFTGTFNGNGHTLSHPMLLGANGSTNDRAALFRRVGGGAIIKNFEIEKAIVEGGEMSAIVAAEVNASSTVTFEDIEIRNSTVMGGDDSGGSDAKVGTLIGATSGASLVDIDEVYVTRSMVEGQGDYVGGLIGSVGGTSLSIDKAYFLGSVEVRDKPSPEAESVGGLIGGISSTGTYNITDVVTRGTLFGKFRKGGGIIGYTASGTNLSYFRSDMAIATDSNIYTTGGNELRIGGVIGDGSPSSVSEGYFAGTVFNNCSSDCMTGAYMGGGGTAPTNVYANNNAGVFAGGVTNTGNKSDVALRALAAGDFTNGSSWSFTTDRYPKLTWEDSEVSDACALAANLLSVTTQIGNGRGTAADPIIICTPTQFGDMEGHNFYFKLEDNINMIGKLGSPAYQIDNFPGNLNGNGHILHGNIGTFASASLGYIVTNNGTIEDLNIIGTSIKPGGAGLNVAGAVKENNGTLRKVQSYGVVINDNSYSLTNVGGLVGTNNGVLEEVYLGSGNMMLTNGATNAGGIVGQNSGSGQLTKVASNTAITLTGSGNHSFVGGVIGFSNSSSIHDQLVWEGYYEVANNATGTNQGCGGLAGSLNGSESITNSVVGEHSMMNFSSCDKAGGLIGELGTSGSVSRSYSAGEVTFGHCNDGTQNPEITCAGTWVDNVNNSPNNSVDAVVGYSTGAIASDVFYTTKAHSKFLIESFSSSSSSATECDISISSPLHTYTTITSGTGHYAFVGSHASYFPITNRTGLSGSPPVVFTIGRNDANYDASDSCANLSGSITVVKPGPSSNGVIKADYAMKDMNTFCPSAPGSDINFVCPAAEWDIVEDGSYTGDGFQRLLDYHISYILGEPAPPATPVWSVEAGKRFPDLLFYHN